MPQQRTGLCICLPLSQWGFLPHCNLHSFFAARNYSFLVTENCQPPYPSFYYYFFSIFTTVASVGNVTLPRSAPSTSLCSSTIINGSFYFCRLYRRRRKETNKNCSCAKFTPDKQHPRGDLTLQFALTHRQILALFRYISSLGLFLQINHAAQNSSDLYFPGCPESVAERQQNGGDVAGCL